MRCHMPCHVCHASFALSYSHVSTASCFLSLLLLDRTLPDLTLPDLTLALIELTLPDPVHALPRSFRTYI